MKWSWSKLHIVALDNKDKLGMLANLNLVQHNLKLHSVNELTSW